MPLTEKGYLPRVIDDELRRALSTVKRGLAPFDSLILLTVESSVVLYQVKNQTDDKRDAMDATEILEVVARLQRQGNDDAHAKAKSCSGGLSKDVWESVSAFANTSGGILLWSEETIDGVAARTKGIATHTVNMVTTPSAPLSSPQPH